MPRERRDPTVINLLTTLGGRDEMIKASIGLQDLRRKIYLKAKSDKTWRFWGLYIHVCKMETLRWAYREAKKNNGAPGLDGVSFADIEKAGLNGFLEQIQMNCTPRHIDPCETGSRRFQRVMAKSELLVFLEYEIAWFKVHSNLF